MRILFAGSSEIAVPTLKAVAVRYEVGAVLTNEPKPGKRGRTSDSHPRRRGRLRTWSSRSPV
ncbi:MAG: hypothetical protein ACOX0D_08900 [Sphaerochaeta sp.]